MSPAHTSTSSGSRKHRSLAIGALAALGLAACSAPITSPAYVSGSYTPQILNGAAAAGGLQTEIVGDPFGQSGTALSDAVLTSLAEGANGAPADLKFNLREAGTPQKDYRVVVLFNAAPNAAPSSLCFNANQPQVEPDGGVAVLAALCEGTTRRSSTRGYLARAGSPDDPAFRRLMTQVALSIFPPPGAPFDSRTNGNDFNPN